MTPSRLPELRIVDVSDDEIYSFMADKYGEWIVFKPQINKRNFMLWFLPYLALILGGIIIFLILKRRKNL